MFKIMVEAGVLPAIYPNSAKMALGWPFGRKQPDMAINRDFPDYVHLWQIFRQTKSKSAQFRIRGSKVPRVLGPLDRGMAVLGPPRAGLNIRIALPPHMGLPH